MTRRATRLAYVKVFEPHFLLDEKRGKREETRAGIIRVA
jgi:hypothetical protein